MTEEKEYDLISFRNQTRNDKTFYKHYIGLLKSKEGSRSSQSSWLDAIYFELPHSFFNVALKQKLL